jgi:hypothetical protein
LAVQNLPALEPPKTITPTMSPAEAMDIYQRTIAYEQQNLDRLVNGGDRPVIEGELVDVTSKPE